MANVVPFESDLTSQVIGLAIDVHKELGPGLLESVYESCLFHEIEKAGLSVQKQITLPVHYKGHTIDQGFRLDLLVDDKLIIEVKSCEKNLPIHKAQLITYLKLAQKPLGLLINFNEQLLKNGIERVIRREFFKSSV